MAKSRAMLLTLVILLLTPQFIYADEGEPSGWAYEEVYEATDNGLVPDVMRGNYQTNIKRYEYVLLALEVLEKNGDNIDVVYERPFSDISDHEYSTEIVKAYNAGIINGYEDGTFRPDNEITRQEVASLIVNLILRIEPSRDIDKANHDTVYSDESNIGTWAIEYIDYCYDNNIMKGTGTDDNGLDIIAPKGKTTIEQAIILLYRLVQAENILEQYDLGTIKVVNYLEGEKVTVESDIINDFAVYCDHDLALTIIELSEIDGIDVNNIEEERVTLTLSDEVFINVYKLGTKLYVKGYTTDISNELFIHAYKEIINNLGGSRDSGDVFIESVSNLKLDNKMTYDKEVGENNFIAYVAAEDDLLMYVFEYKYDLLSN